MLAAMRHFGSSALGLCLKKQFLLELVTREAEWLGRFPFLFIFVILKHYLNWHRYKEGMTAASILEK
jgi:hypothetical protein